jgi:hypothetical protein
VKFFPVNVLNNPIDSAIWFDDKLDLSMIPRYHAVMSDNMLFVENGYADYNFKDLSAWNQLPNGFIVKSVDVIFTHYPFRKEDWITNYYELLANRLKALFMLDERLNSVDINYRLVLQTDCVNANQAKKLLHGFLIHYALPEKIIDNIEYSNRLYLHKDTSTVISIIEEIVEIDDNVGPVAESKPITNKEGNIDNLDAMSILYPESIYNRKVQYQAPKKVKQPKGPDCPSFTTRAHKPKRSILDRIMRR